MLAGDRLKIRVGASSQISTTLVISLPVPIEVGSLPNSYFLISEYQLSTGLLPGHLALALDDHEQNRFSPNSWFCRCSKESVFANLAAQSLAKEQSWKI